MLRKSSFLLIGSLTPIKVLLGLLSGREERNVSAVKDVVPPYLRVANFPLKCVFLRLSTFLILRDNFGSEKRHFLARYFLGNRLFRLDNRFNFSRNNIPSSALPSNFYQKCLDKLILLFNANKALTDNLSCKCIYTILLTLPRDAPRCVGFWDSVLCRPIDRWATVCCKSHLKLSENKKNDLLWLMVRWSAVIE